jgi:hypothetical protein
MAAAVPETTVVQSRFLTLSNELLLQTLRHCLVFDKPITALLHSVYKARLVRLASINKRLYELAMDVYWKENEFTAGPLPTNIQDGNHTRSSYSFKYPGPPMASLVRKLTIHLRFSSDITTKCRFRGLDDLFKPGGDWLFVVPRRWKPVSFTGRGVDLDSKFFLHQVTPVSDPTRWQQFFHLQELKIIITLEEADKEQTCFMAANGGWRGERWYGLSLEQCREDAEKRLAGTCTNVDAKKTVFEVRGMKCSGDDGAAMCGGACARVLEQTLQNMVQN